MLPRLPFGVSTALRDGDLRRDDDDDDGAEDGRRSSALSHTFRSGPGWMLAEWEIWVLASSPGLSRSRFQSSHALGGGGIFQLFHADIAAANAVVPGVSVCDLGKGTLGVGFQLT